jgi:Domain of unknown function (DUF4440)
VVAGLVSAVLRRFLGCVGPYGGRVDAHDAVLDAARRRSEALVARDSATLSQLLHEDFLYVTANGDMLGREEYLDRYVRNEQVAWLSQTILESRVTATASTAVVTCLVHDVATFGSHKLDATFRSTQTWVVTDADWQCLAAHTSTT